MGFNGARKHQKVEDPRWLYWADTLGFLVWGEVPDLPTWAGIAIVTGAGLYTFLREQRLKRLART